MQAKNASNLRHFPFCATLYALRFLNMPHKPRFNHPLRELRDALGKTQWQFARMFGVSRPYIQAIELGQRTINDTLCDDIAAKLGVTAKSLKEKRGMPRALLSEVVVWLMPVRIRERILPRLEKLQDQPRERLHYQLELWGKLLPAIEKSVDRKYFERKLGIFLDAAAREKKLRPVLLKLDRWIENQIASCNLRSTIKSLARNAKYDWRALDEWPINLPDQSLAGETGRPPKTQLAEEQLSPTRPARSKTSASPRHRYKVADNV
jgi:transcriptional regulator with XRE-family HTH domain